MGTANQRQGWLSFGLRFRTTIGQKEGDILAYMESQLRSILHEFGIS